MVNFLEIFFINSITTSSLKFSKYAAGSVILLQIKNFDRNIKEAVLAKFYIKVTSRTSFTRLRVIRQSNTVH